MESPNEDRKQLLLRLPAALKEDLMRKAAENHRSLTAEIVWRLQESLKQEEQKKDPA